MTNFRHPVSHNRTSVRDAAATTGPAKGVQVIEQTGASRHRAAAVRLARRLHPRRSPPMRQQALIVDSRPAVVSAMMAALERAGYSAEGATSFEEARDALNSHPPRLLLTAIRLGAFNGLHLVIRARLNHPHTTAIVISDAADPFVQTEAECYGAACLVRPLSDRALVSSVTRVLRPAGRRGPASVVPIRPAMPATHDVEVRRRRERPAAANRTPRRAS